MSEVLTIDITPEAGFFTGLPECVALKKIREKEGHDNFVLHYVRGCTAFYSLKVVA